MSFRRVIGYLTVIFMLICVRIHSLIPEPDPEPAARNPCLEKVWAIYDQRHKQPIFLFWSNPEKTVRNDLGTRQYAVLEQLMLLHPLAPIVVVSDTLPQDSFEVYRRLGYNITVQDYDLTQMTLQIPALERWVSRIDEWREGPYFASHLSDYFRFVLLYTFGGTYTDFDALYLRPITFLESAVGVDRAYGVCPWCLSEGELDQLRLHNLRSLHGSMYAAPGVMIGFPKHLALMLRALLTGFAGEYDPMCFICVGPKALTLSLRNGSQGHDSVTLLDTFQLYPYNYQEVPELFVKWNSSRDIYNMLRRSAHSIHLFGKVSSKLSPEPGSVVDEALRRAFVTCAGGDLVGLRIDTPDLFDLSRRRLRNAYLFDDVRLVDCTDLTTLGSDEYTIKLRVEHGILHNRFKSGQVLTFSGSLINVNTMLSSLVYMGESTNIRDRITITASTNRAGRMVVALNVPIMNVEEVVTLQIKTHGRADKVKALVRSARQYYPRIPILVSDDARGGFVRLMDELRGVENLRVVDVPIDSGLSYGRNRMLDYTETTYTMVIDDDHVFTGQTDLTGLVQALELGSYDIVAMKSPVDFERWRIDFAGLMYVENGSLIMVPGNRGMKCGCEVVDFAHNKFIARVSRLREVLWDPRLKLAEHEDFFWRAKERGLVVGSCPWAGIYHDSPAHWLKRTRYDIQRSRVFMFMELMLTIHGWDCIYSFGNRICRNRSKPIDVSRPICGAGFAGENCDRCDAGFAGQYCDACEAERYSAACVPCNCPNRDTVCREGYGEDGECVCKCPLLRGPNLLRNEVFRHELGDRLPGYWKALNAETRVTFGYESVIYIHERVMASGLQQYIDLRGMRPTELIVGAEVRAKLPTGGEPTDGYSLYTDVWYEDGSAEWGRVWPLPMGSYDWQVQEGVLQWPRPIVGMTLTLMFRRYRGEVEFRRPYVRERICNCTGGDRSRG